MAALATLEGLYVALYGIRRARREVSRNASPTAGRAADSASSGGKHFGRAPQSACTFGRQFSRGRLVVSLNLVKLVAVSPWSSPHGLLAASWGLVVVAVFLVVLAASRRSTIVWESTLACYRGFEGVLKLKTVLHGSTEWCCGASYGFVRRLLRCVAVSIEPNPFLEGSLQ